MFASDGWYAAGYGPTPGYAPPPYGPPSPAVGPFGKPLVAQTTKRYGGYAPIVCLPTLLVTPPPAPPLVNFTIAEAGKPRRKHRK